MMIHSKNDEETGLWEQWHLESVYPINIKVAPDCGQVVLNSYSEVFLHRIITRPEDSEAKCPKTYTLTPTLDL